MMERGLTGKTSRWRRHLLREQQMSGQQQQEGQRQQERQRQQEQRQHEGQQQERQQQERQQQEAIQLRLQKDKRLQWQPLQPRWRLQVQQGNCQAGQIAAKNAGGVAARAGIQIQVQTWNGGRRGVSGRQGATG